VSSVLKQRDETERIGELVDEAVSEGCSSTELESRREELKREHENELIENLSEEERQLCEHPAISSS
jgi:hypothetical protein